MMTELDEKFAKLFLHSLVSRMNTLIAGNYISYLDFWKGQNARED